MLFLKLCVSLYLRIKNGSIKIGQKFKIHSTGQSHNVDELGTPPLHRGGGPSGVQKKKQKDKKKGD